MNLELPKIYPVTSHTDNVGVGTTFVAIPGTKDNGNLYIRLALEKGATTIVVQNGVMLPSDLIDDMIRLHISCVYVDNCRKALA
jgi:UDP-N-acetylmuramyl pentapeptide synthase